MRNCINPKLVLNPALPELVYRFKKFFSPHGIQVCPQSYTKYDFPYHFYKQVMYNCESAELYFFKDSKGVKYPLFIEVGCGECECCRRSRIKDLEQRMRFEDKVQPYYPLFLTLTYNNLHLPADGLLKKRDFQNFLKRLRHEFGFRYFGCGEYGSRHGRPHYHFIIFPDIDLLPTQYFNKIQNCWKFGYIYLSLVGNHPNFMHGDPFGYVAKYTAKDHKGFQLWSKGLGKEFAKSLSQSIFQGTHDLQFIDKYGATHKVINNNWLLNQVFGSFSRATYRLRTDIYDLLCVLSANNLTISKTSVYPLIKDLNLGIDYHHITKSMKERGSDMLNDNKYYYSTLYNDIVKQLSLLDFSSLTYYKLKRANYINSIDFPPRTMEEILLHEKEIRKKRIINQKFQIL